VLYCTGQGPTCTCSVVNATHVQLSASTIYADSSFNPISANLTWRSNGVYYSSTIPARARTNTVTVTSSIFIDAYDQSNYQLNITFTQPNGIQLPYVSTNAPDFTASCTALCESEYCRKLYPQKWKSLIIDYSF